MNDQRFKKAVLAVLVNLATAGIFAVISPPHYAAIPNLIVAIVLASVEWFRQQNKGEI